MVNLLTGVYCEVQVSQIPIIPSKKLTNHKVDINSSPNCTALLMILVNSTVAMETEINRLLAVVTSFGEDEYWQH